MESRTVNIKLEYLADEISKQSILSAYAQKEKSKTKKDKIRKKS